jgi:endonuclease/exonuclease/phosphatase family metal-dependent hydrolase
MWREICGAALTFVILFWNVENYFDPFDDPLKNDNEFTPGAERHWTWRRFEAKRDGIAQTIVAAGDAYDALPALVGLAEVENRLVVSQLVHKTMLEELGYGFVHRESPDERGIDVALLYRKELLHVVAVDSLRIPGMATRDILYVHFRCPVGTGHDKASLHVFVVHFPSKRGGEKATRGRRETAQGVLERAVDSLLAADPASRIVVMGDFNDTKPRVAGLAVPPEVHPPAAPGTLKYHGRWEQIDWLFVSPALALDARLDIFAPPFLLEPDATWLGIQPKRTYVGPRYHGGLSDHLPIRVLLP